MESSSVVCLAMRMTSIKYFRTTIYSKMEDRSVPTIMNFLSRKPLSQSTCKAAIAAFQTEQPSAQLSATLSYLYHYKKSIISASEHRDCEDHFESPQKKNQIFTKIIAISARNEFEHQRDLILTFEMWLKSRYNRNPIDTELLSGRVEMEQHQT